MFESYPEKDKIMTLLNREFEIYQQTYISLNEKKIEANRRQPKPTKSQLKANYD